MTLFKPQSEVSSKSKAINTIPTTRIAEPIDIHLHQVEKDFTDTRVLHKLSYHFKAGESYLILGANGSGKSTLLALITGFYRPSRGSIQYSSQGRHIEASYKHFGLAAPYIDMPPALTIEEIISLSTQIAPNKKAFKTLLLEIGLYHHRKKRISVLSSGMRQRVLLGMIFGHLPSIILLDEPFHHLDPKYKAYCTRSVRSSTDAGCLVIVCSSDPSDRFLCNHTLLIGEKMVFQ